jgi:hypothetical protein
MDTKDEVKLKNFKIAIGVVGALLLALVIFVSGIAVGLHKAKFSYQWGQNYERNFMGSGFERGGMMGRESERGGMMGFFRDAEGRNFRNAHGLAGMIISVSDNNLIIKDRDNKENTVSVSDKTIIKRNGDDLKITDLKANDQIVVMGAPDDKGVITADLIRVFAVSQSGATNTDSN